MFVCFAYRPIQLISIVKIMWKRSSVFAEVATTTQSWHTCAPSLAEDKKYNKKHFKALIYTVIFVFSLLLGN